MTDTTKPRETPDEWAARMVREHGPVPLRITRRLAHLAKQAQLEAERKEAQQHDE